MKRESILFSVLSQFGIPTPALIGFDESREIIDTPFIVLHYIPGQNMEQAFGSFSPEQQSNVSYQLGNLARKIHAITPKEIKNSTPDKPVTLSVIRATPQQRAAPACASFVDIISIE